MFVSGNGVEIRLWEPRLGTAWLDSLAEGPTGVAGEVTQGMGEIVLSN